jgi:hypothetical protein
VKLKQGSDLILKKNKSKAAISFCQTGFPFLWLLKNYMDKLKVGHDVLPTVRASPAGRPILVSESVRIGPFGSARGHQNESCPDG